jgi:hypothetical protein
MMAVLFLVYFIALLLAFLRHRNWAFALMIVNIGLSLIVLLHHLQFFTFGV